MQSYPNQKVVKISKQIPKDTKNSKRPYIITYVDIIEEAARTISHPTAFKVYMYLLSNQNDYTFALSTKDICDRMGVSEPSAKTGINRLIELGYLTHIRGNNYIFHDAPIDGDIVPVEEVRKQFKTKSGKFIELTYQELIEKVGEDRARIAWEGAQ